MDREQLFRYYSYNNLEQRGSVVAEYVWIDGSGLQLRSKAKTITHKVNSLADLPDWNYDGSSCYQASTNNSEVIMKPVAYFPDPFRGISYKQQCLLHFGLVTYRSSGLL